MLIGFNAKAEDNSQVLSNEEVQEILNGLMQTDFTVQRAASSRLSELGRNGLSLDQGILLLKSAAHTYPAREYDFLDSQFDLISAVTSQPQIEYIPVIVELFPQYNNRAKEQSLRLLSLLPEQEAAIAYMHIVRTYARLGLIPALPLLPFQSSPRHVGVFFPELLEYINILNFEWDIYLSFLICLQTGKLQAKEFYAYEEQILTSYQKYSDILLLSQKTDGIAWMWEDEYHQVRNIASLLLDIMGYFDKPKIITILQQANSNYSDPRLKYFATISLIRLGQEVYSGNLVNIAGSSEMRNALFIELQKMNKRELFPKGFHLQEAFAESDMVNWLTYPTELSRVPDEIELMKVMTVDTKTEDGLIDYYVFRFRTFEPHWAAKDGWMAGVSGPFLRSEEPTTNSYGDTFSSFDPWDSRTPEEHVGNVQDILKRWRDYREQEEK